MIKLGSIVKDNITGFNGVATFRVYHLHGCLHVGVLPTELLDGKPQSPQMFDEQRLEVIGEHPAYINYEAENINTMLGNKVRYTINGFVGIVAAYEESIFGNNKAWVEPEDLKDGKMQDAYWLYSQFIEVIEVREPLISKSASKPKQEGFNSRAMNAR